MIMTETLIIALISLVGSLAGTFGGIMTSNHLTGYRIEQLEKRMEKINGIIDRIYKLEERTELQEHKISEIERKIK